MTATVTLQHDNGTTCGRTAYTHTFLRGASGAPVPQGSAEDLSVAANKLGHGVTFTIVSGQINVNVLAASATPTKHRGQVAWEVGAIS